MKKIALYDPYLNILGGGERYVLSILKVFESHRYECFVFWNTDISREIQEKFSIQFQKLNFISRVFPSSTFKTLGTLRIFDYFIYVTDGSYFFSTAKKNYIYAMVPQKSLYKKGLLNRFKISNYTFVTHSLFTKKQLSNWSIESKLLYPYVATPKTISIPKKDRLILSVGRFFQHLHSKRQDVVIKTFIKLKTYPEFRNFRLVLAGGLQKEDQEYFQTLKQLARNDGSIIFKPNISFDELCKLYELSTYCWHFAGFGVDENMHPELVEHMGIAPIEAMMYGTIPFCYAAGGPKEIIKQEKNGFLFKNENELIEQMVKLAKNQEKIHLLQKQAMEFSRNNFSYTRFEKNVVSLFKL